MSIDSVVHDEARTAVRKSRLQSKQRIVTDVGEVWLVEVMTALLAKSFLLAGHPLQRPFKPAHGTALARALQASKWHNTFDTWKVDRTDRSIDAQHRAWAIAHTGIAVQNIIVAVVNDEEARNYIDTTSKPRTVSDIRRFLGQMTVGHTVQAAVGMVQTGFRSQSLTRPEINNMLESFPLLEEAKTLDAIGRKLRVTSGPLSGALRCAMEDRDAAMAFFSAAFANEHVVDGKRCEEAKLVADYLASGQKNRFQSARKGINSSSDIARDEAARMIRAYSSWYVGQRAVLMRGLGRTSSGNLGDMPMPPHKIVGRFAPTNGLSLNEM